MEWVPALVGFFLCRSGVDGVSKKVSFLGGVDFREEPGGPFPSQLRSQRRILFARKSERSRLLQ